MKNPSCRASARPSLLHSSFNTLAFTEGLIAVSPDPTLAELFPGRFYPWPARRSAGNALSAWSPCPAIHYAPPGDRMKYDIVQTIRTLTLLRQEHPEKRMDGRLHFRTPAEMAAACKEHPEWLAHYAGNRRALQLRDAVRQTAVPRRSVPPDGSTPREFLQRLVLDGLRRRYPRTRRSQMSHLKSSRSLSIISAVGYEEYFLVVWDILQECRAHGIEWITRGSAADFARLLLPRHHRRLPDPLRASTSAAF